jgi:hypothetical protein
MRRKREASDSPQLKLQAASCEYTVQDSVNGPDVVIRFAV